MFAPFVGQFADSFAKGRVMMVANGMKASWRWLHLFWSEPVYRLYPGGGWARRPIRRQMRILGELTTGDKLVKANGLMESSTTIAAILLGSMAGGILADWHVLAALAITCAGVWRGGDRQPVLDPELPAARSRPVVALPR